MKQHILRILDTLKRDRVPGFLSTPEAKEAIRRNHEMIMNRRNSQQKENKNA